MARDSSDVSWKRSVIALSRTVIGLSIILALYWARPVLIPIALAALLTFLLNPIVRRLQRVGLGRLLSVFLAVSIAGGSLTAVAVTGSRQISRLFAELPEHTAKIVAKLKTLKALASGPTARRFEQMIEEISHELQISTVAPRDESADPTESGTASVDRVVLASEPFSWSLVTGHLGSAVEVMATGAFAMVLLVFFLLDRAGLRDRIVLLAGRSRLTITSKALEDATNRVSRYIMMLAIVNGGFGLLLAIGLLLLGVPYAVLWGSLAAVLRFVPYIGPWVAGLFPITMSLAMSDGWWQPMAVFGFVMVLELVTNNIVEPLAFGRTTGVAAPALLISAAFWLYVWGPIGLILSAPFAVSLVVIGKNIPQLAFLNILLGEEPALSDEMGLYQRLLVHDDQEAAAILVQHARETDADHVVDQLVVPALNFAKRDIQRGCLADEEEHRVLDSLTAALSKIGVNARTEAPHEPTDENQNKRLTLLCCAAEGNVDRVALRLLRQQLDLSRWDVEVVSEDMLTSELVARTTLEPPAAICIAAVPPGGIAQARYLCKKLRMAGADIPLVVGRWSQRRISQTDRTRLIDGGANAVMSSIIETRKWLDSRYPMLVQSTSNNGTAVLGETNSSSQYVASYP